LNIYAHSLEECESKLAEMIQEAKAEIAAEKEQLKQSSTQKSDDKIDSRNKKIAFRNINSGGRFFRCLWAFMWSKFFSKF